MARPAGRKASSVKMCLSCHKTFPLTDFYPNRGWAEQNYTDIYCKDCARKMCVDKETLRRYMWENGRTYMEGIWTGAEKGAMYHLSTNKEWLSKTTSQKKKEEMKNKAIANRALAMMNLQPYYAFTVPTDEEGNLREFDPNSTDGTLIYNVDGTQKMDDGAKLFSPVWNGLYTQSEIEYLDSYYSRLEDGYVLDDINIQDYARKVAKASLEADAKYNKMRAGQCSQKEWQEAQDVFDKLSKSANIAACQKKDKGATNNEVLCEIIRNIEINHQADMPKVTFPKDDIDRILADFSHTDRAIQ